MRLPSNPSDSSSTSEKRGLALTDAPSPFSNGFNPPTAVGTGAAAVSANMRILHGLNGQVYGVEDWEERAAIAQFDGGLTAPEAEQLAGPIPFGSREEAA
jgi:hypothetical protein